MLCPKPLQLTPSRPPVPCGQCMACRVNQKRFWTGRIMLEWYHAPESWFVTLTYENAPLVFNVESGLWEQTLDPTHYVFWLKRWRKRFGPVRFFLVGEYGDKTQRPHYHAIIFNQSRHAIEEMVVSTWQLGHVSVKPMAGAMAKYVSQYCLKKMTKRHWDIGARYPEFSRKSTRPPLGNLGVKQISATLFTRRGAAMLAAKGDVPGSFRIDGATYPLGHYWMNWLRKEHGIETKTYGPEPWEAPEGWACDLERAKDLEAKVALRGTRRKARPESL